MARLKKRVRKKAKRPKGYKPLGVSKKTRYLSKCFLPRVKGSCTRTWKKGVRGFQNTKKLKVCGWTAKKNCKTNTYLAKKARAKWPHSSTIPRRKTLVSSKWKPAGFVKRKVSNATLDNLARGRAIRDRNKFT